MRSIFGGKLFKSVKHQFILMNMNNRGVIFSVFIVFFLSSDVDALHEFYEYDVEGVTDDVIARMPDEELRIYYYYYFDTHERRIHVVPKWRDVIKRDIIRRGERVQGIVEGLYDSGKSLSVKVSVLNKLSIFPDINKKPFMRRVLLEMDEYPDHLEDKEILKNKICAKLKFVARYGSSSDLKYVELLQDRYGLDMYQLNLEVKKAKKRLSANRVRSGGEVEDDRVDGGGRNDVSEGKEVSVKSSYVVFSFMLIIGVLFLAFRSKLRRLI